MSWFPVKLVTGLTGPKLNTPPPPGKMSLFIRFRFAWIIPSRIIESYVYELSLAGEPVMQVVKKPRNWARFWTKTALFRGFSMKNIGVFLVLSPQKPS
jgi:hypothetical protein